MSRIFITEINKKKGQLSFSINIFKNKICIVTNPKKRLLAAAYILNINTAWPRPRPCPMMMMMIMNNRNTNNRNGYFSYNSYDPIYVCVFTRATWNLLFFILNKKLWNSKMLFLMHCIKLKVSNNNSSSNKSWSAKLFPSLLLSFQ